MGSRNQEPLDFKLVGMSLKEFYQEIDAIEDIPSDQNSVTSDEEDDGHVQFAVVDDVAVNESDESDDDVPLARLVTKQVPNVENITWSATNFSVKRPYPFTEPSGLSENLANMNEHDNMSPYFFFSLFVTVDMLEEITFQTNLYAEQEFQKTSKRYTHTNIEEIKVFLGINLLMGIKRLPSYRDYWSTDEDLNDPYISKLMPVNRFSWLLSHIHLNDNSQLPRRDDPNYDKIFKIRPFITAVKENFQKHYNLQHNIAIDESMVKFKGRSSLKQYMPRKPIKRGYKIWTLADSEAYLYDFDLYTGKSNDYVEHALGEKVVLRLTENLQKKNHNLYFDNYFNSYILQHKLKENGINACGTVQANRKHLPKMKDDRNMKQGEYDFQVSNDGISLAKWKDKRSVHLLSNFHDPKETASVKRKQKDGTLLDVPCPSALIDYNKNMNFVDRFDQMKSTYELDRKSKKWWMRIFFHFLDCCVVNAFTLYKCKGLSTLTLKNFRRRVIDGLLVNKLVELKAKTKTGAEVPAKKPRKVSDEIRHTSSSHQPVRSTRRRCARCSTRNQQVRTEWSCSVCAVPLCLSKNKTCFQEFHNQ